MTPFQCLPIPTETARRFRTIGRDDGGNPVRRVVAADPLGAPCRHCLRYAEPGETVILGSFHLPRPRGIYWTPSPVFLHAEDCPAFTTPDRVAPIIVGNTLVSVRAYDRADQCLYDLGHVCPGTEAAAPLLRALADGRTSFVNVHTARPGCLLARVERRV